MRALVTFPALLVAFGLATVFGGWWALPIVAAIWALAQPEARRPGATAALAAAAAWMALLLWTGASGSIGPVARLLGGIFGTASVVVIAFTLVFPAVLAGSTASLVAALRPGVRT